MRNIFIRRLMAFVITSLTLLITLPISANAQWRQDSNGQWWNSEGNSWSIGWKQIDSKWYYFNQDGYMKTGWLQSSDGKWYYLKNDGSMAVNETVDNSYKVDNNGVWIQNTTNNSNNMTNITNNINNGIINNGVININNSSATENTGKIVGWREIDGKKYFYDANGIKVISVWVNVDSKWYYFDNNGVMLRNTWFHDKKTNKSFYLQDDGSKAINTIIDGKYKVDENGIWIGNVSEFNSMNSNSVSDIKEEIDIKNASDLENYLNEKYSKLKTPLGTLKFEFNIDENYNKMFSYDFWIQTGYGDIENPKYGIDYFSPNELENSIKISNEDKGETKELLKEYQEKIAEVVMEYFPNKKIQGGFFDSWYKYQSLRTGYESRRFYSWNNYEIDKSNRDYYKDKYNNSELTDFHWDSENDDYFND